MGYKATARGFVNFVVVGSLRAGAGVAQATISSHPAAVCHCHLFHPDVNVRRTGYEDYFGTENSSDDDEHAPWNSPNPQQYIKQRILRNALYDEQAVGLLLFYTQLHQLDLYDLLEDEYQRGAFRVVHIYRNPVACFVSQQQALRSGLWRLTGDNTSPQRCPVAIGLDLTELVDFVRAHASVCAKTKVACPTLLSIAYCDLFRDFQWTMARVFEHLGLKERVRAVCSTRRLQNRDVRSRIFNWDSLYKRVPSDVRVYMDAADLF